MKRTTITMDGCGRVAVPSDAANVWINEMELVKLFDVIAPTLRASIRAVYKSQVLHPCEVEKAHQIAQRLLCGCICPADGRGTLFPYRHTQYCKGAQCPVGKAVLAKRQTSPVGCIGQRSQIRVLGR